MARPRYTAVVPRVWQSVEPAEEFRAASFVMVHASIAFSRRQACPHRVAHHDGAEGSDRSVDLVVTM